MKFKKLHFFHISIGIKIHFYFYFLFRYFTKQELKELFTLDNPRISKTQQQLEEMHSQQRKTDSSLDAHIAFLYSLGQLRESLRL